MEKETPIQFDLTKCSDDTKLLIISKAEELGCPPHEAVEHLLNEVSGYNPDPEAKAISSKQAA